MGRRSDISGLQTPYMGCSPLNETPPQSWNSALPWMRSETSCKKEIKIQLHLFVQIRITTARMTENLHQDVAEIL